MSALLALDQGTTGVTAILVDSNLQEIAQASEDFPQHFPKPGWVEHDLEEIWNTTLRVIHRVLERAQTRYPDPAREIAAIGITNQRETICFWDRKTARPLARAIVWQDRRTAEYCQELRDRGLESEFQSKTGLLLDPYFSGTKISWALKNWPVVAAAEKSGTLAVGTIDSFVVARLTAGAGAPAHVTDPTNASRTLLYRLDLNWDAGLCRELGVNPTLLPEVRPSAGEFGKTSGVPGLPDGIPICGILGDQQSALLGQACLTAGTAKCTYGTGAFVLLNTGTAPVRSSHRLLTTIAWKIGSQPAVYALEGSAFIAGAAVQWVRDSLGFIRNSAEIEALATSVPSADGVVFVPALTGLGAPYWNPDARGLFSGLTRGTTRAHLSRAVLEGIAYQIADILQAMIKDAEASGADASGLKSLHVDGGASENKFLMQFQSDILGVNLVRPRNLETTSLGAIFAAGLGAGVWTSISEIEQVWQKDCEFNPKMSEAERARRLDEWHTAVRKAQP